MVVVERLRPDASWWLKFDRAQVHLENLQAAVAPYTAGRKHNVTRAVESSALPTLWTYRVWFSVEPDQRWGTLVGDYLFNMRSALDHIAVMLNPPRMKDKLIYFPMYRDDPWRFQEGTRRYVERDPVNRRNFSYSIKNMADEAQDIIHEVQPYTVAAAEGKPVDDYALVGLKRLNDTDKHRRMLVVNSGCDGARVTYLHPDGHVVEAAYAFPNEAAAANGAKLMDLPFEVEVEFMGSLSIGFGRRAQPVHKMDLLEAVSRLVQRILLTLEPHIPSRSDA
jgi:hypothetical protein